MKNVRIVLALTAFVFASISLSKAGDTYIDKDSGDIFVVSTYVDDYACAGDAGGCTRRVSFGY